MNVKTRPWGDLHIIITIIAATAERNLEASCISAYRKKIGLIFAMD
jgi:hypothetical protein